MHHNMAIMSQVTSPSYSMHHNTISHTRFLLQKTSISNTFSFSSTNSNKSRVVIVASSPPTQDVDVATHPLTKQDLIDYLASGCKTKDKWR